MQSHNRNGRTKSENNDMEKITIVDEKFYGRMKSRNLTVRQESLFETLLPEVKIDSFEEIDTSGFKRIFLEIGFGSGEHIAKMAMSNPNDLFIGCEPFINGVASLLVKIDENKIKNIRIYQFDARILIKGIPENILSGVFLLFPDPWPKRKHIKRRFLQDKTIIDLYNRLKVGGFWRLASDHKEYKPWILKLFNQEKFKEYFDMKTFKSENRPEQEIWPVTRYEQKAIDEILYVECVKRGNTICL